MKRYILFVSLLLQFRLASPNRMTLGVSLSLQRKVQSAQNKSDMLYGRVVCTQAFHCIIIGHNSILSTLGAQLHKCVRRPSAACSGSPHPNWTSRHPSTVYVSSKLPDTYGPIAARNARGLLCTWFDNRMRRQVASSVNKTECPPWIQPHQVPSAVREQSRESTSVSSLCPPIWVHAICQDYYGASRCRRMMYYLSTSPWILHPLNGAWGRPGGEHSLRRNFAYFLRTQKRTQLRSVSNRRQRTQVRRSSAWSGRKHMLCNRN